MLTKHSHFFRNVRENLYNHALDPPGSGSFRKKMRKSETPYGNTWLLLTFLEACDWSGLKFGCITSRGFSKNKTGVTLFHCYWDV